MLQKGQHINGRGSTPMVPFWGRFTAHFSLFEWGLGYSLGVRGFDPWPNNTDRISNFLVEFP